MAVLIAQYTPASATSGVDDECCCMTGPRLVLQLAAVVVARKRRRQAVGSADGRRARSSAAGSRCRGARLGMLRQSGVVVDPSASPRPPRRPATLLGKCGNVQSYSPDGDHVYPRLIDGFLADASLPFPLTGIAIGLTVFLVISYFTRVHVRIYVKKVCKHIVPSTYLCR